MGDTVIWGTRYFWGDSVTAGESVIIFFGRVSTAAFLELPLHRDWRVYSAW
jgi:hypothetical protein